MRSNFDFCLQEVLKHEGGYVDHPRDPGGATNRGITHKTLADWRGRPVSKAEVAALSVKEAGQIYKALYWDKVRGDELPPGVDLVAFDAAVNSGPSRSIKWLQSAVKVRQDGKLGPQTMAAIAEKDPRAIIDAALNARRVFLRSLSTWDAFGRGWTRRLNGVTEAAVGLASKPQASTPAQTQGGGLAAILGALVRFLASIFKRKK